MWRQEKVRCCGKLTNMEEVEHVRLSTIYSKGRVSVGLM